MRKLLLIALMMCSTMVEAQKVADMWISIPAEKMPYLTLNDRKEMVECMNIGVDTKVRNKLDGMSDIKLLTDDYGCFVLSEAKDIQILRLPFQQDSIFCYIETLSVPEQSSMVSFYDKDWKILSLDDKLPLAINDSSLFCRPDTIPADEYRRMIGNLSLRFVEYRYDVEEKSLNVIPHIPMIMQEERNRLEAIVSKKSLKWDGQMFN